MNTRKIGLVGLGRMGSAMAHRLLEQGWRLVGYDVDPRRAETIVHRNFQAAASLRHVAQECDRVLVSVFDGVQLAALLSDGGGLLEEVHEGLLIIDTSTVDPETSRHCAQISAAAGARFLRATVSGNPGVAAAGQLGIYCSGREEDYQQALPVIGDLSAKHIFLGAGEESRYAKLAISLMVAGMNVLLAEALALAEGAGINRADFFDCVRSSVVSSKFTDYKGAAHMAYDYTATMTPGDIRKDLGYVLASGRGLGISTPTTAVVDQTYGMAEEAGYGELDFGAVVLMHKASRESWEASAKEGEGR